MRSLIFSTMLLASTAFGSETDQIYAQGVEALRQAQDDASKLVLATKLLAKAAALYEADDNESKVVEVNACLYWAKKKLTLADTEVLKGSSVAVKRLEAASKVVEPSEGQKYFDRADTFAKSHASDQLLVAIHYYEVADRFKDSDAGHKAMDASLLALQRAKPLALDKPIAQKEVQKKAPLDLRRIDYENLTVSQWESVQVNMAVFRVQAKKSLDTKIDVLSGQEFVLLPHPDDRWWALNWSGDRETITDFKGYCQRFKKVDDAGKVTWKIGSEEDKHDFNIAISGSGRIYIQIANPNSSMVKGEIRVKLVKVK